MTDPIVTFLTERLADDERAALDSILPGSDSDGEAISLDRWEVSGDHDIRVTVPEDAPHRGAIVSYTVDRKPTAHIARFDPRRVLADVEAKRAILAWHQPYQQDPLAVATVDEDGTEWGVAQLCDACSGRKPSWPCRNIRLLASAYRDHPDYDPRWS